MNIAIWILCLYQDQTKRELVKTKMIRKNALLNIVIYLFQYPMMKFVETEKMIILMEESMKILTVLKFQGSLNRVLLMTAY